MSQIPSLPKTGEILAGRYRIENVVGSGAMGCVFSGIDKNVERKVAIKVLAPALSGDENNHRRFAREARVTRQLSHPNTIRIYDYGHTERNLPYIVMEFLKGDALDEYLKQNGPLSLERAVPVARQVLSSIADAHENRVIHRDLKPANIMLCQLGGQQDFPKVLDFGIAKVVDACREGGSLNTFSGLVIGSPVFMSPERIRGEALSPASDLFSFGLIFSEMLSGESLYPGLKPIEVLARHMEPTPIPLPAAIRKGPFRELIEKAVDKDLGNRYQSAVELIDDLHRYAKEAGIKLDITGEVSTSYNLSEAEGRRRNVTITEQVQSIRSSGGTHNTLVYVLFTLVVILAFAVVILLTMLPGNS